MSCSCLLMESWAFDPLTRIEYSGVRGFLWSETPLAHVGSTQHPLTFCPNCGDALPKNPPVDSVEAATLAELVDGPGGAAVLEGTRTRELVPRHSHALPLYAADPSAILDALALDGRLALPSLDHLLPGMADSKLMPALRISPPQVRTVDVLLANGLALVVPRGIPALPKALNANPDARSGSATSPPCQCAVRGVAFEETSDLFLLPLSDGCVWPCSFCPDCGGTLNGVPRGGHGHGEAGRPSEMQRDLLDVPRARHWGLDWCERRYAMGLTVLTPIERSHEERAGTRRFVCRWSNGVEVWGYERTH